MASIPLPALHVEAPQPPDTLGQIGKVMQLKSLMQGQQLQGVQLQEAQQNLAARQALNAAFASSVSTGSDGKPTFDSDKLQASLASGPAAYRTPEVMEGVSKFQKTKVDLQNAIQDFQQKSTDMIGGAAAAVKAANYDPTLAHSLLDQLPASPQLNQLRAKIDGDPTAFRQMIDTSITQSTKQREVAAQEAAAGARVMGAKFKVVNGVLMDVSGAQPKPAMGAQTDPTEWAGLVDSVVPADKYGALNMRTKNEVGFYVKQGNLEAAQKAVSAAGQEIGTVEKETNPQVQAGKVAVATAEGQARANIEAQVARGGNAALAKVPPHLVAPATAAATKAGEEYAAAQSVTQRMSQTMDAARRGNVVAYQIIPEEGTLQITTSQGVHRINKTEIDQYAGGGSLWQRMQGHFGKALSGQTIPASVLNDMAEIQKIQADGAQSRYENSLKTVNQYYGSDFKPVGMTKGGQSGGQHVIQIGNKQYQYNGSGDTADLKNYSEVK